MEESRSRVSARVIGSATSFPTRAADSVSDSARHSCSSFRCVIRSVSTCLPRGNLVDGLPRAPSSGRFLENLIFLETGKVFNVYPFALKAPPQSLLRCLGRSVTLFAS